MNKLLKKILIIAKDVAEVGAEVAIPGASLVIDGVQKLVDHDKTNNVDGLLGIENGIVTAINSFKPDEVIDAALINQGVLEIKAGFEKVRAGVKK